MHAAFGLLLPLSFFVKLPSAFLFAFGSVTATPSNCSCVSCGILVVNVVATGSVGPEPSAHDIRRWSLYNCVSAVAVSTGSTATMSSGVRRAKSCTGLSYNIGARETILVGAYYLFIYL